MAYIGLNDDDKFDLIERVLDSLIGIGKIATCASCPDTPVGPDIASIDIMDVVKGECPKCGETLSEGRYLTFDEWVAMEQMIVRKAYSDNGIVGVILELPFDGWIDTTHDTFTLALSDGYETFPMPRRDRWVIDIEKCVSKQVRKNRRLNRKGAVTAA